jgi:16S rRNA (uracil1498-N3)-methyltransferase
VARLFVRADAVEGNRVTFDAAETRHLSRVLRLRAGDAVVALDGQGQELTVQLVDVGPRSAAGIILARQSRRVESPLELTLVQGIPKGDKIEGIVRMATELGVNRVTPVITGRTISNVGPGAERWSARLVRWQRVAREAAKQCGRAVVPVVDPPRSLSDWLADAGERGMVVCLWEAASGCLDDALPSGSCSHATLVVGPEGGLSEEDVSALRGAGAVIGRIGPRILRTETAGPVGLALLQARYGDLGRPAR